MALQAGQVGKGNWTNSTPPRIHARGGGGALSHRASGASSGGACASRLASRLCTRESVVEERLASVDAHPAHASIPTSSPSVHRMGGILIPGRDRRGTGRGGRRPPRLELSLYSTAERDSTVTEESAGHSGARWLILIPIAAVGVVVLLALMS